MKMTILTYKGCWRAPGYRDLTLVVVNPATGKEFELRLPPEDVQSLIFDCAGAARQIGAGPPIDWDAYRAQIFWPMITPWQMGPVVPPESDRGAGA
jgi:hypothetical protein